MNDEQTWLLKQPDVPLTPKEREWFDWAFDGAKDAILDPDWLADNDDALTFEGQMSDLRYRLEEQAYAVAETDATGSQLSARIRTLDSLNGKLKAYYES